MSMLVAVFNETSGWSGKTIDYDEATRQFVLQDHGPITAEDVLRYDAQGQVDWAREGLLEWVLQIAAARRPPAPAGTHQTEPAPTRRATAPSPVATPAALSGGGLSGWRWVWRAVAVIALFAFVVWFAVVGGASVRNGVGIAFTLLAVVLIASLAWGLVKLASRKRFAATVASLLAVSIVFAVVLWWMPHYQVIVPTDKRVLLGTKPMLTVKVKNDGLFAGTYTGSYALDGIRQADVQLPISAGQTRSVDLPVPGGTSRGRHLLVLGGTEIAAVALRPATLHVSGLKAIARTQEVGEGLPHAVSAVFTVGEGIVVIASVKNVGDVSGTFSGTIEANGKEVIAQPAEVAPGRKLPLTFPVTRTSVGLCKLQVGDAATTVMVVKPIRLANGYILRRAVSGGTAGMTIKNPLTTDAMVMLTRTGGSHAPVLAVYVRAKNQTTINNLPVGRYTEWDCEGTDWNRYTRDFLTTVDRFRWPAPLVFSSPSSSTPYLPGGTTVTTYTYWTNGVLSLGNVPGKDNAPVSVRSFPKL